MIFLTGPKSVCGCGNENATQQLQCCQVLDLGIIYEEEPQYDTDKPCKQTRLDTPIEEGNNCDIQLTPPPHGKILDYKRACARLVVWNGAKIINGTISGQRHVLYSRQRDNLPQISGGVCINPIRCPATNGLYDCCAGEGVSSYFPIGGPYLNCEVVVLDGVCELQCNSAFRPQLFKYGMSNCSLNGYILAGYATAPSWWFLNDSAFNSVESAILENNPHGENFQTIYAHFQVEWKPIKCDSRGGIPNAPCFGEGRINLRQGRCGDSYTQGLPDKDEREKAVKITAAIGFSIGGCGFTPPEACEKTYSE